MGLLNKLRKKRDKGETSPVQNLLKEVKSKFNYYWDIDLKETETGSALLDAPREEQKNMVLMLVDERKCYSQSSHSKDAGILVEIMRNLMRRKLPFSDEELCFLFEWVDGMQNCVSYWLPLAGMASALENFDKEHELSEKLQTLASSVATKLTAASGDADSRKYGKRISDVLGVEAVGLPFVKGDVWADAATEDCENMDSDAETAWANLISFCQGASAGKPSAKWNKQAEAVLEPVEEEQFATLLPKWFALADKPAEEERSENNSHYNWVIDPMKMQELNQDILKGLVWCCALRPSSELIKAISALCVSAFKKIPGVGPRAGRLGNACIYVLGAAEGEVALAQLALLKVKIKNRSVQKQIAKALEAAAERAGVTTEDLEEMSAPDYGMTDVGVLEVEMGEFTARLTVEGTSGTNLVWIKPDGKPQKSVPASVKTDFAEDLKELRATAKDIQKMLPAVRQRIDNLFLAQKSWTYTIWKERYHDHPLVGSISRRLIWWFGEGAEAVSVIFHEGAFIDAHGNEMPEPADPQTIVRIWHPLDGSEEEILSWRNWLEEHLVQQPFKQAHREIYLLTDAEENTATYSNRYAAHILRQHQFNALCLARDWRNTLRLMVDDDYPPASRYLPQWGIRAEFWIEGVGQEYGTETTETGTYLYLATDQVRFYPIDAAQVSAHAGGGGYGAGWGQGESQPMALTEVPPIVFSEIMRDVDLFVGVASVGNDPEWQDGGPNGRHRDYWQSYSFGSLSTSAKSRKEVLERLLPRLKIANKANIQGKFLIVEGSLRTYKIHLGSGNILMEPNDQYLCIVPNASIRKKSDGLFLPFEGDRVMAIILSKAFLLADDTKIKDPTIVSQIKR